MQTKPNSIQVPLEFAEAQYLRGLSQSSKISVSSQSGYLEKDRSQSQIFFPLVALTLSLLFLGFNGIVFVNRQYDNNVSGQDRTGVESSTQVLGEMTSVPAALRSETTKQEYTQLAQMYLASINDELTELSSALSNLRENPSETSTIRELIRELETKMDKLNQTKKSVQSILTKIESSTAELMITPEEKMLILAGNDKS
jgi:hypothetical protein